MRSNQSNEFVDKKFANTSYKKEIEPGSDKAILQLADGSTIALEHVRDGEIALQGNSKIIKTGNKLNFNILSNRNKTVYNSLTTPHSGEFQIALPDGSQVWLNGGSRNMNQDQMIDTATTLVECNNFRLPTLVLTIASLSLEQFVGMVLSGSFTSTSPGCNVRRIP